MIKLTNLLLVILLVLTGCLSRDATQKPVTIIASKTDDACGGVGLVVSSIVDRVTIFSSPALGSSEIGEVEIGSRVLLCDESEDWYGVVVLEKGLECISYQEEETSRTTVYLGPCVSGWIEKRFVELFAG